MIGGCQLSFSLSCSRHWQFGWLSLAGKASVNNQRTQTSIGLTQCRVKSPACNCSCPVAPMLFLNTGTMEAIFCKQCPVEIYTVYLSYCLTKNQQFCVMLRPSSSLNNYKKIPWRTMLCSYAGSLFLVRRGLCPQMGFIFLLHRSYNAPTHESVALFPATNSTIALFPATNSSWIFFCLFRANQSTGHVGAEFPTTSFVKVFLETLSHLCLGTLDREPA